MRTKNVKPYAYGSLYKENVPDNKILPMAAGNLVNFNRAGPFQNTRPDVAANRIKIFKSGVYHITADVSVILEIGQTALFNINLSSNGTVPLTGSFFEEIGNSAVAGKTIQAYLNVGDEVGIYIADAIVTKGNRPGYNRAALTVHLLDY